MPNEISILHVIIMAKAATPGRVKTRLTSEFTARQAADIHRAMLTCVLARVIDWQHHEPRVHPVVAMASGDGRSPREALLETIGHADEAVALWAASERSRVLAQGSGDLGDRLRYVWGAVGSGAVMFLGVDSPDVPADALDAVLDRLGEADAAIGPVDDGGYWTLASGRPSPALVSDIDWGSASVYDQTHQKAVEAGLSLAALPGWYDVDTPADLQALRRRLMQATSSPLLQLKQRLDAICEGQSP